jgi:hypothetical protein
MNKAWLQISLMILVGSSSSLAADFKRFEFQPFGGFTASGGIPLKTEDSTTHGTISVNNSHNIGATFGVNFNELDAVEGLWRRQYTEARLPSEIAVPASSGGLTSFDLKIDPLGKRRCRPGKPHAVCCDGAGICPPDLAPHDHRLARSHVL